MTELGAFRRSEFLCISVLRVASEPRVKLVGCKSALPHPLPPPPPPPHTHTHTHTTPWFLTMCHFDFVLVFFGSVSIAITSLGEERANQCFSYVCSVCACLDLSVSSSSWGLGRAVVCDCGTPWTFLLLFWASDFSNVWFICACLDVGFLFLLVSGKGLLVSGKGCGLWLWHSLDFSLIFYYYYYYYYYYYNSTDRSEKKVREKSRECHNHKPQPFPGPKRNRKPANPNKHKPNKRTKSTKISSLFPKRGNRNTKRTEKHKNKMTHGKTYNKSPRRINHKATKSKANTGTTALEWSVEQTTGVRGRGEFG